MFNASKINQVSKGQDQLENGRDNITQYLYTNTIGFTELVANDALSEPKRINNNYSPKRKWLVVDNNYRAAKQRGIYPPLAIFLTDRLTFLYTFNAHKKRMMKRDLKISK